jgi:hypothetical protein
MDQKEFRKAERRIIKRTSSPPQQEIIQFRKELEAILQEKIEATCTVVSVLIYDRGRMSLNNYLTQLDESSIFGVLNLSTQHRVHYPFRLPNEETYHHGYFVPASEFRKRSEQPFPENAFVVLGSSIPLSFDPDKRVITYAKKDFLYLQPEEISIADLEVDLS